MHMTENPYVYLEDWLTKSRNLEIETLAILQQQTHTVAACPELAEKIERHERLSRQHVEKITACIELLMADPAYPKNLQGTRSETFGRPWCQEFLDEPYMDASMRLYIIEHCAISQYKIAVEIARQLGQDHIADMCEEILCHEEEMAFWLEQLMPEVAKNFLNMRSENAAAN